VLFAPIFTIVVCFFYFFVYTSTNMVNKDYQMPNKLMLCHLYLFTARVMWPTRQMAKCEV